MNQLIEILSTRPEIIFILLSWPVFLWVAKVISQKVLLKYENK